MSIPPNSSYDPNLPNEPTEPTHPGAVPAGDGPGGKPDAARERLPTNWAAPLPGFDGGLLDDLEIVAEPARSGPGARKVGLLMAAALVLIGGGVGLLLWQRGTTKPATGPQAQRAPTAVPVRKPAEPPTAPAKGETGIAGVTASQSARMQFMDRRDPNRVAGELRYSKLEPLERGQQLITEPRAWIYLKDGRTVHVQAAKAKLTTNTSGDKPQEPEAGTFEGAVVVRMYPAGENGQFAKIDVDTDRPSLMFTTDAFTFNSVLSEVTTASTWEASAPTWEYKARGMRLVYDEVSQRIELFETDGDNTVTAFAGAENEAKTRNAAKPADASAHADPNAAPAPTDAPVAAAHTPEEVIYRAELTGPVTLAGETQRLEAPEGTVWVRLIDGALREGAVAPVKFAEAKGQHGAAEPPATPTTPTTPEGGSDEVAAAPASSDGGGKGATIPTRGGSDKSAGTMTWPGPITVRPVKDAPELAKDDVRVRLNGEEAGSVVIRDEKSGLNGRARALEYGATTRALSLSGPGESGVFFAAAGGQTFEADTVSVDMGSGIVTAGAGRGVLNGPGLPADQAAAFQQITWDQSAEFTFEMKDGAMTSALRRAEFSGSPHTGNGSRGVIATDRRSALSGDQLVAEFSPTKASPNVLSKVVVIGSALAEGGSAGSLGADSLAIEFTPDESGREGEPTRVLADGNVLGQREGTMLRAGRLETGLARDSKNNIGPTQVFADDDVRFDRPDGVGATARSLVADAQAQTVVLTGSLATEPASVYKDKSIITGERIDLDGKARTLLVTGAGNFSHEQARRKGPRGDEPASEGLADPDIVRADATWTKGMRFNDTTGVLECEGEVVAMTDPAGLRVDLVRGNRVRLELTPAAEAKAAKDSLEGLAGANSGNEDRRLLRAEVFGHSYDTQGGAPAVVESRQFAPPPAGDGTTGRTLERLLYIEGDHVIADAQADTMNVPGPGKALIDDRRRPQGEDARPVLASQPSDLAAMGKTVGSSLFLWDGSMVFERRTGVLDLHRFVRVVHQPVDDPTVVKLEAERLTATLRSRRGLDGQAAPAAGLTGKGSAELVKVDALDAVYLESQVPGKAGTRRLLLCDKLNYNADARTVEAFAADQNRLTLFDETKGTAVTAERLFWDIATDRSEIIKPTPISAPR